MMYNCVQKIFAALSYYSNVLIFDRFIVILFQYSLDWGLGLAEL